MATVLPMGRPGNRDEPEDLPEALAIELKGK
jgi:hypothetical protein